MARGEHTARGQRQGRAARAFLYCGTAGRKMAVASQKSPALAGQPARPWIDILSSPWMLAVILLVAFLAYLPTLDDWYAGDDFWFLRVAQREPFWDYILRSLDFRETSLDLELNRYRPLYPIVWRLQFEIFGLTAWPYHAVLLGLHLASVVLTWWILRRLLDTAWMVNLATFVFALHPGFTNAIEWLSGGNRVFATVPALAAMLLFMKAHDDGPRARRAAVYVASILCYVVAILMHSSTIFWPGAFVLWAFFVHGSLAEARDWRSWLRFLPFFVIVAALSGIQLWVRQHLEANAFDPGWHMYANYMWYLGLLAIPIESYEAGRFETEVMYAQVAAAFVLLCLLFALVYRRSYAGLGLLAAGWFSLALLPDTTFMAGGVGRALHTAAPAGALLLVLMLVYVRDLLPEPTRSRAIAAAPYALVAIVVPLACFTYARTLGTSGDAAEYERFRDELRAEVTAVPEGGTLYIVNAPLQGAFSPPSIIQSLVGLYYGDTPVVVVPPGASVTPGPLDRLFTFSP